MTDTKLATGYRKLFYERLDERYPNRHEEGYPDPKTVELMHEAYLDGIEAERAINDRWEDEIKQKATEARDETIKEVVDGIRDLLNQLEPPAAHPAAAEEG
jgi:hypothetical protein